MVISTSAAAMASVRVRSSSTSETQVQRLAALATAGTLQFEKLFARYTVLESAEPFAAVVAQLWVAI